MNEFVKPTREEYRKWLFQTPTIADAIWVAEESGEPMTEEEFESFSHGFSPEFADTVNQNRSLTATGWYIKMWYVFFKRLATFSYENYCQAQYEKYS